MSRLCLGIFSVCLYKDKIPFNHGKCLRRAEVWLRHKKIEKQKPKQMEATQAKRAHSQSGGRTEMRSIGRWASDGRWTQWGKAKQTEPIILTQLCWLWLLKINVSELLGIHLLQTRFHSFCQHFQEKHWCLYIMTYIQL